MASRKNKKKQSKKQDIAIDDITLTQNTSLFNSSDEDIDPVVSFSIEQIRELISENVRIALTKFMRDSTDRFEDVDHQIKTLDKRMTEKLSNLVPTNKYESLTKLVK